MQTSNPVTMNKFTKIVLVLIGALVALCVGASFTACDLIAPNPAPTQQTTQTTPSPTSPAPANGVTYSYDLPKGFEWFDTPSDLVIINRNGSKDGAADFVKMEPQLRIGTAADAKADIKHRFDDAIKACAATITDPDTTDVKCTWKPEYKELKIPGTKGTTVYMALDKIVGFTPEPFWYTSFAFEAPGNSGNAGYIMSATFDDRADLYQEELATIINTLQIKKVQQ